MSTNRVYLAVVVSGIVIIIGAALYVQRERAQQRMIESAHAQELERDELMKKLEKQRADLELQIADGGVNERRFPARPKSSAPCQCAPGDPLCSCL